jgi:predicted DNA-binding WGR domain protein
MRRFEFVDGKSNKFWEAKTEGPKLMVRFGRIGGTWQESDKLLADAEKAHAEMEKLIREKTRKGYLEVGGKPEVKVLAKAVAKKGKTKEPKPQSMEATISPAERKAKAQKVLLMFANGQWEMAHNILETAQDEDWLFEQLLNGCKIEKGKPIPSNAIKKAFMKEEKSSPVLAMLNIMLCNPRSSKALKSFKFERLKELDFGVFEGEEMPAWMAHVIRLIPMSEILMESHYLKHLSDNAAEALGKCKGGLYLGELKSLSDAAAEALSKHKGDLYLNGLTSLSDAAAESLSKHMGDLRLGGLKSLSDAAAESLSKHKGYLNLYGLKSLSDAAAESLSKHKGNFDFRDLKSLSDAGVEALSKHKGDLRLGGLKSLSDAAAESLSKHKGQLNLGELKSLSDAAAESLSKHNGQLNLYDLKSLSDAAAEALSKHKGYLNLAGLESLSDTPGHIALAKKLASQKDELWLNELTSLSAAAAKALSKHEGELKLRGSLKQKVEKYKKQGRKK